MYEYREFCNDDIPFVAEKEFIMSLQLQYDKDFEQKNAVTVLKGKEIVLAH